MPRRLRIALVALGSLFVLAACTAPTPTPTATPPATPTAMPPPSPTPPQDPGAYLEESLTGLDAQGSFHFDMEVSFTVGQGGLTFNVPITFTGDALTEGKFSGTISLAILGTTLMSDIIVTEERVFVTDPATGLWELATETGAPYDPLEVVSAEFADFAALTLVGREELNGVPVYHLAGRLEADELGEGSANVRVDYWVGVEDRLPRRVRINGGLTLDGESEFLEMAQGAIADITMEMDLSDFGKPVVVEAPITATEEARTEFRNVSTAVTALTADNNLATIPNPTSAVSTNCTTGTQNMALFPDSASVAGSADKLRDPAGVTYVDLVDPSGDRNGYLLLGHDITGGNDQAALVNYVSFTITTFCDTVNEAGDVTQYTEDGTKLN